MNITIWYYDEKSDTKYFETTLPIVFTEEKNNEGKYERFIYGIKEKILVQNIQCINPY